MFELFPVHSSPLYILYIAIANYQVKMDERLKDFQVTAHRCFLWKSCSMANCCILLDSIQNIESLKDLIFSLRIQIWYMNCQELSIDTLGDSDCWSSSFRKYLHIWYVFDFIWFLKNETKKNHQNGPLCSVEHFLCLLRSCGYSHILYREVH